MFIGVIGGSISPLRFARRRLRPIIYLPDLEIGSFFPANAMPPTLHILRERTRADFAKAVEVGPRQDWETARETAEGSP